jgi:steroid delta-isomerase-like uncharacterized protein
VGEALDAAQTFFKAFAGGDLDSADAVYADDCAFEMPVGSLTKAEHRAMGEAFKAALPDAHMEVRNAVDGGDEVFLEGRFVGTHTGDFVTPEGTIPASGRTISLAFADYFKVRDGLVVEHRTYWDQVAMMTQLQPSAG